jgi:Tol biopolymer transport system component
MASFHQLVYTCCGLAACVLLAGCGGNGTTAPPSSPYLVVFERNTGPVLAGEEIYVMDGNGNHMTKLTNNGAFDGVPSVSYNSIVTFESAREPARKIYRMGLDGSNQIAISQDYAYKAKINAAGTSIAYIGIGANGNEVWTMDSDGSNRVQLTFDNADADSPTFTPDGQHIVFQSNKSGNDQIYSMDLTGSNVTRLTNNSDEDTSPAISPDGTRIAFARSSAGSNHIYVMNIDGSNQTALTTGSSYDIQPVYTFDGAKIFFTSGAYSHQIWRMDADGSNRVAITHNGANSQPSVWQAVNP